ncbi:MULTISPECIES: hypothetical protein [Mycolicibacter]|uniref:PPE family protein n=2 Tax=Mycolicibacter TaxID=1073531 RepID=A0ABU5XL14_9MYCO|nr:MULTISPECIES: hypothetical protein [unclassified Mycolicibacter]MEB3022986.1 hypothetical protein [Mycolicibacter sp. MYC098]MEB3033496.1 hypothetical protein [Mycolicibacter sp. MYC340]
MWTTPNGYSRAIAGVATAGVVALTAGSLTAAPAMAYPQIHSSAPVFAPVELTALTFDSSLMDIVGTLTGLNWIIPFLDSPDNPLFPIVISLEALGELFVIMPLALVIGTPLLLLTEGWQGIQDTISLLSTVGDDVRSVFSNLADWYETRNWLTGELLHSGSSEAVGVAGWDDLFHNSSWDGVIASGSIDAVPSDVASLEAGPGLDGFDTTLTDLGLGELLLA